MIGEIRVYKVSLYDKYDRPEDVKFEAYDDATTAVVEALLYLNIQVCPERRDFTPHEFTVNHRTSAWRLQIKSAEGMRVVITGGERHLTEIKAINEML